MSETWLPYYKHMLPFKGGLVNVWFVFSRT
jgi:hypothetical protein